MAKYHLTDPSGAEYEVDAPDEHAAVAALMKVSPAGAPRKVVTDPALLAQLNAPDVKAPGKQVTDPALLAKLNAPDSAPIHIGAPDGSVVEFPAGTSDDTIKGAMAKAYPAPAAAEPKSTLQTVREAIHAPTRILENGYFMGLGDRARALIDSAVSLGSHPTLSSQITGDDGSYGANLKREQGDTSQFASDHPIASPVIEGVGGIAAPIGALAAAAKGVSLGGKMLYGAGAGGAIGAAQGVAGSKDWTDPLQVAKDAGTGFVFGGALGGAMPAVGKAVGATYNAASNAINGRVEGMSRAAGNHLVRAVEADGPAAVQARMTELGPDAMLVDGGASLLGTGQGALGSSMEARSAMTTPLKVRNEGTNARIQEDVNRAVGPYDPLDDPQTVTNAIKAHRSAVDSVNYPVALDNAPPVKIAPIMTDLIDRIDQTPRGSMEHKALTNLQEMLTKTEKQPMLDSGGYPVYDRLGNEKWHDVPSSHDDANILHKVKGELDNIIEYDAPGLGVPAGALQRQQGALKQMRGAINSALEEQVPGYANANAVSAALAKRGEAVGAGTQYLGNGKTTPSPGRFAADFNPLDQGTKIAFAKGSRGEIERILGTKANDLQALRGELQGEGGWNTAKLATVHGQPAADELTGSVNRNLAFRDTHNKIVENSQTDLRKAAREEMKPSPSTDTPLVNPNSTLTGMAGTAAKKGIQSVINAITRTDPTRSYGEVARALTEQGTARDARLLAIMDALNRRQGNTAVAGAVGDRAALLLGATGNGAADELRNRRK